MRRRHASQISDVRAAMGGWFVGTDVHNVVLQR